MQLTKQKTNTKLFQEFAMPYLGFIYKSACRLCGNPIEAEDLAQETFLVAFENFSQLKDISRCKSWLFVILKNIFLKTISDKKKYLCVDLDKIDLHKLNYSSSALKSVDKEYFSKVAREQLQSILDKLDEKYKIPLVLSYLNGFSYQEIADMLEIPIGTVMSRISRGKMYLKKELLTLSKKQLLEGEISLLSLLRNGKKKNNSPNSAVSILGVDQKPTIPNFH